jgi:hypothetical protein
VSDRPYLGDGTGEMNDAAILVLNLTFLVTLGVAVLMFVGSVVLFTALLLFAGAGQLLAFVVLVPFGRDRKTRPRRFSALRRRVAEGVEHSVRGLKTRTERPEGNLPLTVRPAEPRRAG